VREALGARFAGNAKIAVRSPEEVEALPDQSFDLIVMHSVSQYLSPEELDGVLKRFRRLVKPDGRVVLGDVVPPVHSLVGSASALLTFAARNGFFLAALFGLVRTAFSDYSRLRARVGLTFYDEAQMLAKLGTAGLAAQRASHNIGHDTGRMTFVATPR
jgi:ubiquinone/menaquinone biosynthesis C-methylase UbiE